MTRGVHEQEDDMGSDSVREIHRGRVVHLVAETVTLPNGHSVVLEIVRHPGAAAIVALTDDDQVLLVRQYRHAAGGYIVEIPAGKLDGETPDVCAARELIEEAGVEAGRLEVLGSIVTTPGFSDEVIHVFLATDLRPATQKLEADEVLTVERVPFATALAMCARGEIRDAKSMCGLLLADLRRRGVA
jgi:ADP-ribose pyrophosphatase